MADSNPFDNVKATLVTVSEIVVFLFAAFGSYLTKAAPPASRVGGMDAEAVVGFASFAALLVFLTTKAWLNSRSSAPPRQAWFRITVVLVVGYFFFGYWYQQQLDKYTFGFPLGEIKSREVSGLSYSDSGNVLQGIYRMKTGTDALPAQLIQKTGARIEEAIVTYWTPASVLAAHNKLVKSYVIFIVVLATGIASLLELVSQPAIIFAPHENSFTPPPDTSDGS